MDTNDGMKGASGGGRGQGHDLWKVGEVARRTGLTVRTLHHYDNIGLLPSSKRTASGYRLYDVDDLARLQKITSLRQLGVSLADIKPLLVGDVRSPLELIEQHIARAKERVEDQQRLCRRLESIADTMREAEAVSADDLFKVLEMMTMFEKYYTPQQLEELEQRRENIGEDRIRQGEIEWAELIAAVRAEMDKGTAPDSPSMRPLTEKWMSLIKDFTGGNAEIKESLGIMYRNEPSVSATYGLDSQMFAFVAQAIEAVKRSE